MPSETPTNPDARRRGRLIHAKLTPEQRAAVEARRVERQTGEYQDELARDIEAYRQEYPPVGDLELIASASSRNRMRMLGLKN
jgi:hypothetical protein